MATYIRLTDYKSSDEKEQEFFNPENRYEAKQEDFEKIPGSPIAYWVSDKTNYIFENSRILGEIAEPKVGLSTGDNDYFLKQWSEIELHKIGLNFSNREDALNSKKKWFPLNKGGEFCKWYGNYDYLINWEEDGIEIRNFKDNKGKLRSRPQNLGVSFLSGITWSAISTSYFGVRYMPNGSLLGGGAKGFYPKEDINYFISFMTSKVANNFLIFLSPTINFEAGDISKLPIVFPNSPEIKQKIDELTQQNIDISKEEWDSRETSWDFAQNEIFRILNEEYLMLNEKENNSKFNIQNLTLETIYNRYCDYWREKFFTLHKNEEELNRLFIDIYELQDELTPVVELKDITILKNETKIIDNELVFQADEVMKQFISYGVGVMFGRYSLDHEGLHIANMNESLEDANAKFNIQNATFEPDDDNIIPVLEDDYFKDDIASRFVQFVKATFGEENLSENIRFIENSLGTTLRKYFVKGFYEDHIKRYKKRPIYWMVASPKKGFMSLIYMHRYKSDVFATVQNSYLREYITKLEASRENYQREADDASNSNVQRNRATKEVEKINKTLDEVIKFDREVLTAYAQNAVEIDLDNGVKVNYCKFKDVLYEIKGLCK